MTIDLSGRTILVTGAGSGIGAATARCLADSGALVIANDRHAHAAAETAHATGGIAMAGDVGSPEWWADEVVRHGPIHGIVHNAGYDMAAPFGGTDRSHFDELLRVMVTGPFELTQRLLPAFPADGGCVLFVASVHALATEPGVNAYAAAKGALVSMVRSAVQDLGPRKIRVLAVSPGYVDTPLLRKWIDATPDPIETRRRAEALHPMGRIGRPEDIAALVTFLLSPLAEFVNGTNVVIDGALTAQLPR